MPEPTESDRPSEWSQEHKDDQDNTYEIMHDEKVSDEEAENARQEYIDKWGN